MSEDSIFEKKEYSTQAKALPRTIDGEDYEIRVASGKGASKYIDAKAAIMKTNRDGKVIAIRGLGELPAILLAETLWRMSDDRLVSKNVILGWPRTVQEELFQDSMDFSNLREKDEKVMEVLEEMFEDSNISTWTDAQDYVEALPKTDEYRFVKALFKNEEESDENFT